MAVAAALFVSSTAGVGAMVYHGTEHRMVQPDGVAVSVYLYGTELYIDAESRDHYTLIKDESTGYVCYALLSSDGGEYASSGIVYRGGETPEAVKRIVSPGIRISKESREKAIEQTKKTLGMDVAEKDVSLRVATALPDTVFGICCLIDFTDTKSDVTVEQIETFLNADNETVFRNSMSIKKYYQWISGGKLTYLNYVPSRFYTAPKPKEYYSPLDAKDYTTDLFFPVVEEALLSYTKEKDGFDLTDLTTRNGAIVAINILYAGTCENEWATGLWPHMNTHMFNLSSMGFKRWAWHGYQMMDIAKELQMATFVHETGHLVCGWPDFYSYDDHEDNNATIYNVADIAALSRTPQIPNPWALDQVGWLPNKIDITDIKDGRKIELRQEVGSVAVYRGSGNSSNERYYIEIRDKHRATSYNKDKGIFIWHSNDKGDNTKKGNPEKLDCRPATSENPFWTAHSGPSVFSDESLPSGRWYSGEASGIYLWDFSDYGTTMTFRCGPLDPADSLAFSMDGLPDGTAGGEYNFQFSVSGGVGEYLFEVVVGELPPGLELGADGRLFGEPEREGHYSFSVRVVDEAGQELEGLFAINVLPSVSVSLPDDPIANGYVLYNKTDNSYIYYNVGDVDVMMIYSVSGVLMEEIKPCGSEVAFGAGYPAGVYWVNAYSKEAVQRMKVVKR